jgi:signal transduction histidine kinase
MNPYPFNKMDSFPIWWQNRSCLKHLFGIEKMDKELKSNSELEKHLTDLKQLHYIITDSYHDEDSLFSAYLTKGRSLFGLETGIISHINLDEEEKKYTVVSVSSPLEELSVGQEFLLENTYCREVIEQQKTIAYPHIGADDKMNQHPVYVNLKLESYLSAPIYVDGEIYGTINFTDRSIHKHDFSSHQLEIIEIMALTIGRFLEAQIQKRNVKRLISIIAHDVKTPIGNVLSLSDLLLEEDLEGDAKEYAKLINEVSSNSLEMVSSILEMSSIDDGKAVLRKEEVEIGQVVRESWNLVKNFYSNKDLTFKFLGDEVHYNLDQTRFKRALMNLFTNAAKFSNKGSEVLVEWNETQEQVILEVTDKGVGIPAENIDFIFDHKKPTSTPGTEGEVGTGYGLPLVARIASLHGGSVTVESQLNKGTTFKICLPKSE